MYLLHSLTHSLTHTLSYKPIQYAEPLLFCILVTIGDEMFHSYHTLRSLTQRHTFATTRSPALTLRGVDRGMKRGNQLNIPGVSSLGTMDMRISPYKVEVNEPINP